MNMKSTRTPTPLRPDFRRADQTLHAEWARAARKRTAPGATAKVAWPKTPASGPSEYPVDLTNPADPKSVASLKADLKGLRGVLSC